MRIIIFYLLFILPLTSYSETASTTQDEIKKIRFSHVVKRVTPKGIGAQMFKRLVNKDELLKNKFKVEVYPESSLYTDEQVIDALLADKVQFAAPSLSVLCKKQEEEEFCEFDKFYEFDDVATANKFQQGEEGQKLLNEVTTKICDEKKNCLVGLFYWHNGMKQLTTTQKCSEDHCFFMKENLTFRTQDSETIKNDFERIFGNVTAKHIPFKNVPKSLEKGNIIQGQENTWSNTVAEGYDKIQHCFIETNHGYLGYIVLTNTEFWNGLTESDQKALKEHLAAATEKVNNIAEKYNNASRQLIDNTKIISLTKEEVEMCKK